MVLRQSGDGEARTDDLSYLVNYNLRGSRSRSWGSYVLDDIMIMMLHVCYSVSVAYLLV